MAFNTRLDLHHPVISVLASLGFGAFVRAILRPTTLTGLRTPLAPTGAAAGRRVACYVAAQVAGAAAEETRPGLSTNDLNTRARGGLIKV